MVIGLDCAAPQILFDDMKSELPVLGRLMDRGRVRPAGVVRSADHRAGLVVHDQLQGSGHARLLRLPQPQGPLLRRAHLRHRREDEGRPRLGHPVARRQARGGAGRSPDVSAAPGERRDDQLLSGALDRLEVHLPRGVARRDQAGRRRVHGGRAQLPHRPEGPDPARHQRDDEAPVPAGPPPARLAPLGLLHDGRDGYRPPAPRVLALLRPRPSRLRARHRLRAGVPRLLPLPRLRDRLADRGAGSRTPR